MEHKTVYQGFRASRYSPLTSTTDVRNHREEQYTHLKRKENLRQYNDTAFLIKCKVDTEFLEKHSLLREERKPRVFENRMLRRIFGPRRDEVKGEWRRVHNEELNDLYSSPNIVRVIKSRRMRWAGHVAHMG